MKRVIIAAAVMSAAFAAQAQSNVTVYGIVDMAYGYSNGGAGASFSGLQSGGWSGSRFGFKGSEDLGNGLSTLFTLEYGVNASTGAGPTTARQSFVGIDSKYGAVTLGRQYSPSGVMMGRNSAFEITGATPMNQFVGASTSGIVVAGGSMSTGDASRWNNSIAYQSKDYSGFSGRMVYSFGEAGTNTGIAGTSTAVASNTANSRFGIGGSYVNGGLNIDAIYQGTYNYTTSYLPAATHQGGDINEYYIGGGYDFKVAKVVASYQKLNGSENALNGISANVWSVGAIYPVTAAGKIRLEYAHMDFDQNSANQPVSSKQVNGSSSGWGIGYTHDLSKRTMLYAEYGYIDNGTQSMGMGANNVGLPGQSNYTIAAGIKHSF